MHTTFQLPFLLIFFICTWAMSALLLCRIVEELYLRWLCNTHNMWHSGVQFAAITRPIHRFNQLYYYVAFMIVLHLELNNDCCGIKISKLLVNLRAYGFFLFRSEHLDFISYVRHSKWVISTTFCCYNAVAVNLKAMITNCVIRTQIFKFTWCYISVQNRDNPFKFVYDRLLGVRFSPQNFKYYLGNYPAI